MRPPEPEEDTDFYKFFPSRSPYDEALSSPYLARSEELSHAEGHTLLKDPTESHPGESAEFTELERIIFIQTQKVGYLIGHHGRTIWGFESSTGAKIDILRPKSRASETPVRITGPAPRVRHAIRLIMDLYALNNFSSQHWQNVEIGASMLIEKKNEKIATEEILIAPTFASFLIQNELICYIEALSQAKILICRELEDFPDKVPLNIVGEAVAIEKALCLIQEHREKFNNSELSEVYANLPLKVFVDNPYRKFGRNRRNYWRRLAHHEVGENICQRSALSFLDPEQDSHFQDPDWKPDDFEDYHSAKESFESTFELVVKLPNIDRISLHPICRYNNVTMETFIIEGKKTNDEKSAEVATGRRIVIRGLEPNVKNAKLELLREIEIATATNLKETESQK